MTGTLKIWEAGAGPPHYAPSKGIKSRVLAVALTPDGKRAVSASDDRTLKIWELDSGRLLRTLEGHEAYGERGRPHPGREAGRLRLL